jgi:hypothetical protein
LISWWYGFPKDTDTYRSCQQRKDEEAEWIRKLEEAVHESRERELSMKARMKELEEMVQSQRQSTSEHGVNVSPTQHRSSCASTELPTNQDEALQHFPVDDISVPLTPCELHIPMVNTGATVLVVYSFVSPVVPGEEAPTSHGNLIPPSYYSVGVDRVINDYKKVALDFPIGDGKKTLGQAEHAYVVWHKRYIIIPSPSERAPSSPPQLPHDRCGLKLTK